MELAGEYAINGQLIKMKKVAIKGDIMKSQTTLQEKDLLAVLSTVIDPDLNKDIVTLGFVKNLKICDGKVSFDVELTTPACPLKDKLKNDCMEKVKALPGIESVSVSMTSSVRSQAASNRPILSTVKNIVAVASGKGGVGKSSVASNLAIALAKTGAKVGLMDADVYGPTMPTMFGINQLPTQTSDRKLIPIISHGIKIMSMGLLTTKDTPIVWRGPMATKLIQQFLGGVEWGILDYLLIDLPPGTGDVQLTLTQSCPLTGAVIVTTPQDVAMTIAMKGVRMFQQVNVPILGMVENMSYFQCPHCSVKTEIFRHGKTEEVCKENGITFLGEIPLDPEIVLAGDAGEPVITGNPLAASAKAFSLLAGKVAQQISIVNIETEQATIFPKDINISPDQKLSITWNDMHKSIFTLHELRASCPCAACIDEWTGVKKLDPQSIPENISLLEFIPVGRYAVNFSWSDGHNSGVYPYKMLRKICECQECTTSYVNTR